MIIKILSSARNFEGIDYSERKNEQGKSQLLKAGNFEALGNNGQDLAKSDYINYMKLVSQANPRVVNKQFHAVISAKGKSHTIEKLAEIAEQYLRGMGYGKNPYLIYAHTDTENNHVHMVSTRVDKEGQKVNARFEKIRSQKVLQQILNQDPSMETQTAITEALQYNFSTKAQFKLLLENKGFKITEISDQLNIIKYGLTQANLNIENIDAKISAYTPPEERIRQLKAIFHKYKRGMEMEAFMQKMHRKFGLELIFHQNRNHDRPYGYTIIDHKKKEVLKGVRVMPLRHLFIPVSPEARKQLVMEHINQFDFGKNSFSQFNESLKKEGFQVNRNGEIFSQSDRNMLASLDKQQLDQLKYNDRLTLASAFTIDNETEKSVLAKLYQVHREDIQTQYKVDLDLKNYYADLLLNANQKSTIREVLANRQLEIIRYQTNLFLLDRSKHHLLELKNLLNGQPLDLNQVQIRNLDVPGWQSERQQNNMTSNMSKWLQLFDLAIQDEDSHIKRRKRKQRQI
jgi:hypothetical protein